MISLSVIETMTPEQLQALDGLLSKREKRVLETLRNSEDMEEVGKIARACHNEPETSLGKAARSLQNKVMGVLEWEGVFVQVN